MNKIERHFLFPSTLPPTHPPTHAIKLFRESKNADNKAYFESVGNVPRPQHDRWRDRGSHFVLRGLNLPMDPEGRLYG